MTPTALPDERSFWIRRLHSATGFLPAGIFLVLHLVDATGSTGGAAAFNEAAARERGGFLSGVAEIALVALPLLVHAGLGLLIAAEGRAMRPDGPRGALWLFQRASGLYLLFFLLVHVWTIRVPAIVEPDAALFLFELVAGVLSNPLLLVLHVVGVLAAAGHLAAGLWTASIRWGLLAGPRAARGGGWVALAIFVLLSWIGLTGLSGFLHRS